MKTVVEGPSLNLGDFPPPEEPSIQVEVGNIYRTRRGSMYIIIAIHREEMAPKAYYVSLSPVGQVASCGQILLGYPERNWQLVGKTALVFDPPEWYVDIRK